MKIFRSAPRRFKNWISGSIRRKLTFFVVFVCILLIALVWLLGVQLLEPSYNASIRKGLTRTLDTMVQVMDNASAEGIEPQVKYQQENITLYTLSQECVDLLNDEINAGNLSINNLCIDLSNEENQTLLLQDSLPGRCVLHGTNGLFGGGAASGSELLAYLRGQVLQHDITYYETTQQMIMGRTAANGTIAVIVSTNLESIPQALGVLRRQMLFVSLALLLVSILCAFGFSRWFAEPITRLSAATKEMARGNYEVSVVAKGEDEIAALTRDFNTMAREVKQSADLQRDLIANVSHDLRTPLTLIKGYAETVRDLTGNDPEKRGEGLNVIVDETDRLSALVGSVMELSRMSSGNEKPVPVRFDLTQLCDEVTYRYDGLCRQNGYSFVFSGDEPCEIYADPGLVERTLHNLLGNALSHVGEDGYVGLRVFKKDAQTARVEVMDHGPGIAPQDISHLFDRYYRSRADAGKPGTGLGLSITKAIFEAHGFAYGVQSAPDQGATFWFEAPLAL